MAFEWVAGLFQGDNQQTRGLSGDNAQSVALDDANPYYNYRLRRHRAEGDIVQDPGLLWYTSPYVKRRTGLGTHVGVEVGDGTANYTDILLIISRDDFASASNEWQQNVIRTLQQEFENFCRRENFSRLHAHRPLGVRILEDGSPGMGGQNLNLTRGEFVTGLLPNLYTGPVRGSYPVIGVHVNLPGVWEGYHEVGRLHNDQVLFTLGNHWLDNFSHPSLEQAALYRLRQYPDGSFVHIVNPDLQDRYEVTSTDQGGASVLTLGTRDGVPLAYLVLAVIDPPAIRPAPRLARPGIQMPKPPVQPTPRSEARDNGVPSIAPPMLMDDEDVGSTGGAGDSSSSKLGGKTIIPDTPSERIFTFQERGALLQRVHFSAFMLGYDVYLGSRGELGTHVEDPAATFQVRKRSVALVAHIDGVMVGGRTVPAGLEVPIEGDVRIEVAGQQLEYRDLRHCKVDGWPYVGEIRRPASSTYMIWGEDYQVGRSRECRVVLPDEPRNENIHWKPSVGDGATIRARTGEIPKARFYTDSIMVASEHSTIDLRADLPRVVCTARHCYSYVRRNGEVMPLYPSESPHDPKQSELFPGDEVLIGNCLFHVGYSPADAQPAAPAPRSERTADDLAQFVPEPDIEALDHKDDSSVTKQATHPGAPPGMMEPYPGEEPVRPNVHTDSIHFDGSDDSTQPGYPSPGVGAETYDASEPASGSFDRADQAYIDGNSNGAWDGEDWSEEDRPVSTTFGEMNHAHDPPVEVPKPFPDVTANGLPPHQPETVEDDPTAHSTPATGTADGVVFTDDNAAKFELGRPMHLILAGWTVNGEVVCGNHDGANLVVPENRIVESQTFASTDYFRLRIRGHRGELTVLNANELLIDEDAPQLETYADPGSHVIDIIRRDERGESDFAVRLRVVEDSSLPDPRARFVALDFNDPLAAALVTRGLPTGTSRRLNLGGLEMDLLYDNDKVIVSGYVDGYRKGDGFYPFFVQKQGARFKTAPEDGTAFELMNGDRMVIGSCVYVLREE
ncbi:MAG: hypothetical protein AAGA48_22080 [Myxococcota bacterium]